MTDNKPATIRGAAAERTGAKPNLNVVVREMVEKQTNALAALLPAGDPESAARYSRLVISAVKATPALVDCFATDQGQVSVMLAVHQLASVGLEPNTPLADAWLLPRKNKGVAECQAMISYRGLMKLARRSGIIKSLRAEVVYAADEFEYAFGLDSDEFRHVQHTDVDPHPTTNPLTHAYAIVRYTNGGSDLLVLNRRQIEKRRASSDSYRYAADRSPWTTNEEDMWRKSAMRALLTRSGLLEAVAQQAVAFDEHVLSVEDGQIVAEHRADDDLDAIEAGEVE